MKEIILTQGQTTLVDDEDYDELNKFKWYAHWSPDTKSFYARRNATKDGKRTTIRMHQQVIKIPCGFFCRPY